ncbi:hypothetical protein L6164_020100 [Bauhinia variegata]|uniref:Uncharacterized protein n=1 Tax=Bauhinia variegata TaxID=167791 RepID=A0ACB9MUC6_BAUVA|nr:hypothetical protein L6164_020100 [Bauhinia variegata]
MPPKIERNDVPVVNIDCSDDENGTGPGPGTSNACSSKTPSQSQAMPQVQLQNSYASNSPSSVSNNQMLQSRSFWKAGDYVVGPISKPAPAEGDLEHARVHPKFLHSNATSHKWAFGEGGGRIHSWLALCFVSLILINLAFGGYGCTGKL